MTTQSEIVTGPGGTMFAGPDAVALFQAMTLKSAIGLLQSGIQPRRGYTMKAALAAATSITRKPYKRTQAEQAKADLDAWCLAMRAALPVRRNGEESV